MPIDITAIKTANESSASHSFGLRGVRGAEFCFEPIFFLLNDKDKKYKITEQPETVRF
jgi:hypothetical protein